MKRLMTTLLAAASLAGVAQAQMTLDWASTEWTDGTASGLYNALSGATGATAAVNTLSVEMGSGLTATVVVSLGAASTWQNGSAVYGGWAPRVINQPLGAIYALGVGSGVSTAKLDITFSAPVQLSALRIGDLDTVTGRKDQVTVNAFNGLNPVGVGVVARPVAGAPVASLIGDTLTLISGTTDERDFGVSALTSWVDIGTGESFIDRITLDLSSPAGAANLHHGIWLGSFGADVVVPEPSVYALLLGVGTLAIVGGRRVLR